MPKIDEHGRPEPPAAGSELDLLVGFLEFHRATLAWKCGGLSPEAMRATVGRSTMSLGGLLKHMALVDEDWFCGDLMDRPQSEPFASVDWQATPNWEWESAADDTPEELFALWEAAVERSRAALADALAEGDLDQMIRRQWPDHVEPVSLRWILIHLIEEYARHNGHADLLREAVDGDTGE